MKKLKYIKFFTVGLLAFVVIFGLVDFALAGKISEGVNSFGSKVYGGSYTPPQQIAALVIQAVLTFLGVIFIALIIYGGFLYMTAMGESDKVKKGKNVILYSVIGLVIILAAYAITSFVVSSISNSAGGGILGGSGPQTPPPSLPQP
jgi:hypothetical protein